MHVKTFHKKIQRLAHAVLLGAFLIFGAAAPAMAGQVVASVDYEVVSPPANLPDDFSPVSGATLKFLSIKAIDGYKVEGALWEPRSKRPADTTMLIMVHGSGGSYLRAQQSALSRRIVAKGYASISINTRQHDANMNTDNFFDISRDIDSAVQVARALGYKNIAIQGHSLGTIHVLYYAATNWDPDLKGVILTGAFGDIPWKTRNIIIQNEESFEELKLSAFKALRDGKLTEVMPVKMHSFNGQEMPLTAEHFFTYRWEDSSVADSTFWIPRVPLPILLVRDQSDLLILPFEPYMLLSAANTAASLVPSIDYVLLPSSMPVTVQGHSFVGNEQPLADTVVDWLAKQGLK